MSKQRQRHSVQFKFQVALEAAKGLKTVNQIASEHNLHPNQVSQWKKQLLEGGTLVFQPRPTRSERQQATREAELYERIGRLQMELAWLEKKAAGLH